MLLRTTQYHGSTQCMWYLSQLTMTGSDSTMMIQCSMSPFCSDKYSGPSPSQLHLESGSNNTNSKNSHPITFCHGNKHRYQQYSTYLLKYNCGLPSPALIPRKKYLYQQRANTLQFSLSVKETVETFWVVVDISGRKASIDSLSCCALPSYMFRIELEVLIL